MKNMSGIWVTAVLLISAGWIVPRMADGNQIRNTALMTTTKAMIETFPACAIDEQALDAAQRDRHTKVRQQVMLEIQEIKELPNGYALRLPLDAVMIQVAAEFISFEQKCCSFFGFNLEIEPNNGPLWLAFTGDAGAKEFLQAELGVK